MTTRIFSALIAILAFASAYAENVVLRCGEVSLELDRTTGTVISLGKGENLLSSTQRSLFRLRLRSEEGKALDYEASDAASCICRQTGKKVAFTYSGFADPHLKVTISVRQDTKNGLFCFSADIDTDEQIEWIEYGCVNVVEAQGKEGEGVLWPYNEGALIQNASKHQYSEPEYPSQGSYAMYPGMICTPFVAQASYKGGVYLGAHDPERNTRQVDFQKIDEGIRLLLRLYPGAPKGKYHTGEETVLGCFDGSWYAAADIYRRWFEGHHRGFVRIEDNKDLPKWYSDPFVILTYCVRGHHDMDDMTPNKLFPYTRALPVIEEFMAQTGAPVMALLMHWEGTAPWAPPYVWPPYGGEDALREFADRMHALGGEVGVYCSGMGWTQKSNLLNYDRTQDFRDKHLADYMCTAPDGSLPLSMICTGQRSGYDMCPACDFTKTTLREEMKKIRAAGIDYVQMMDQNHGGTPYMCYSHYHGHPAVPGTWESVEARKLYTQVLKDNPGLVLGCESAAAEPFIPQLLFSDNRCGLNFNGGQPVPLYSYLYREYLMNFMGNNVCGDDIIHCRDTRDIFQYRLAYSFLAGDILTVVIDDEGRMQWAWGQRDLSESYRPNREASLRMIKELTAWRRTFPEFLQRGKALHPLVLTCPTSTIETKQGPVEVPAVLTASYEYKGRIMHFLVNWKTEEVTVSSPELKGKAVLHTPDGQRQTLTDTCLTLPPLSIVAL